MIDELVLGRFSTGQETSSDEMCVRIGHYADGVAAPKVAVEHGRFSTGQELHPGLPANARVGSFADTGRR